AAACGVAWVRAPALLLALLTIVQLALGAGAWITRFGFEGYVAVYGSALQVTMRTSHVLCGMLLFVMTVLTAVRAARLRWLAAHGGRSALPPTAFSASLPPAGGMA